MPATLISSISITAANYALAWSILDKYYNRPKLIVEKHLKAICDLPKMRKASYEELARFANILETNSSEVRLLGQATYDTLLIHFMTARLDNDTRLKWCEDPRANGFPTEEQFLKFLHERRDVLFQMSSGSALTSESKPVGTTSRNVSNKRGNSSSHTSRNQQYNYQRRGNVRNSRAPSLHRSISAAVKKVCPICKSRHDAYRCAQILQSSVEKRLDLVKRANLCIKCMRPNHEARDCRFRNCRRCKLPHNTLLHDDRKY